MLDRHFFAEHRKDVVTLPEQSPLRALSAGQLPPFPTSSGKSWLRSTKYRRS